MCPAVHYTDYSKNSGEQEWRSPNSRTTQKPHLCHKRSTFSSFSEIQTLSYFQTTLVMQRKTEK